MSDLLMVDEETPLALGDPFATLSALWRVNHALERASHTLELRHGVSSLQRWVLRAVGKYPGITPGQLADIFFLDASSVTFTLNSLEKKKFIERRRVSKDKRRITVGLTSSGRKLDAAIDLGIEVICSEKMQVQLGQRGHEVRQTLETLAKNLLQESQKSRTLSHRIP